MKLSFFLICILLFAACEGSKYNFEDFTHADAYKKPVDFEADSLKCHAEKDKHSNKIEGRKLGFKGSDTGYLGCMRFKGWNFVSKQ